MFAGDSRTITGAGLAGAVFVSLVWQCLTTSACWAEDQVPAYAKVLVPAHAHVQEAVVADYSVVVYSKAPEKGNPESSVLVFRKPPDGEHKLVWRSRPEPFYEPVVTVASDWSFAGGPMVIVARQAGAAASLANLLGFQSKGIHNQSIQAPRIDVLKMEGATRLVKYDFDEDPQLCVPAIMAWKEEKLVDESKTHSQFFRDYLNTIEYKQYCEGPYATTTSRFVIAKLKALAGETDESRTLMSALLSDQKKLGDKADKDLCTKVQNALNALGN